MTPVLIALAVIIAVLAALRSVRFAQIAERVLRVLPAEVPQTSILKPQSSILSP